MKIPKSLKLPRKLKKEFKKGFTRNIHNPSKNFSRNPDKISVISYIRYTYSGSNTKSFYRLCKFARKEEKRLFEKFYLEALNHQFKSTINEIDIIYNPFAVLKNPNVHMGIPNM